MPRTTPGNYVPLDVNFPDRDIRRAGPDAEQLFVRALPFAKRTRSGGLIDPADLPEISLGLRNVQKRIDALVREKLWIAIEDGWQIRSWDRWNDDGNGKTDSAKRANCKRWHFNRGIVDPACDYCSKLSHGDTHGDSPGDSRSESDSESEVIPGKGRELTTNTSSPAVKASVVVKAGSDDDPDWVTFWEIYPRKAGKKTARLRWASAVRRVDAAEIIAGTRLYADRMRRLNVATDKIKMAEGWLNADRWADEEAGQGSLIDPNRITAAEVWG